MTCCGSPLSTQHRLVYPGSWSGPRRHTPSPSSNPGPRKWGGGPAVPRGRRSCRCKSGAGSWTSASSRIAKSLIRSADLVILAEVELGNERLVAGPAGLVFATLIRCRRRRRAGLRSSSISAQVAAQSPWKILTRELRSSSSAPMRVMLALKGVHGRGGGGSRGCGVAPRQPSL